jgi:hypothetical protein
VHLLVILIGLLFGLSSLSDAALLCWNDEISLRCDITPDDWDTETERHYMEERESAAAAIAGSFASSQPAHDPIPANPSIPPTVVDQPAQHYDCQVTEVTSAGIPAVTCTP